MNILIIGATSAIAGACARVWVSQGTRFFLVGRDEIKLGQAQADLEARGATQVSSYVMDANNLAGHADMLSHCVEALQQIDIVLIAHGTLPDQAACQENVTATMEAFATNSNSVIAMLTLLANRLEMQKCGTIAVISSVAGDRGRQSNYVYGAAKAAVSTFCEGLRARLFKSGVHLVTIKPGFVATPMTQGLELPTALVSSPEKVAEGICRAIDRKKNVAYVPGYWALIMLVIKSIPAAILKRTRL